MLPKSSLSVALLVLLASVVYVTDAKSWLEDEAEVGRHHSSSEGNAYDTNLEEDATAHDLHHHHHDTTRHSSDVARLDKSEQIVIYETDLHDLRAGKLARRIEAVHKAAAALNSVKSSAGWFPSSDTTARIAQLDANVQREMSALAVIQKEEQALISKLKPLYGIVSAHFYQEQKNNMASSLKKVQELSYNQAWYSSLFNMGRAESFSDLIIQFFIEWLLGYLIMYPFAVAYYAFWTLPWSIFEYSNGLDDIVPAVIAYVVSVSIMLLPLVCIVGGAGYMIYKNKDRLRAFAEENARRREQRRAVYGRQYWF